MDRPKQLFFASLTFSIILEILVRTLNWWPYFFGHMDSIMHFFWGVAITLGLMTMLKWSARDAFLAVLVWQMVWEAIEIIGDKLIAQVAAMLDSFFYDGVKDTVCDALGSIAAILLVRLTTKHAAKRTARQTAHRAHEPLHAEMVLFLALIVPGLILGAILTALQGESASVFMMIWIVSAALVVGLKRVVRRVRQ